MSDEESLVRLDSDESVAQYLYRLPRDRQETHDILTRRVNMPMNVEDDNALWLAAVERTTGVFVGEFMLRWVATEHRQGEIGGAILPAYHGRGYAREVYGELLRLAFDTYDLHRVVGHCDGRNGASIRSLAAAGLEQEAHFVENEWVKGTWTDEVVLALRQSSWRLRTPSAPS